MTSVKEKKIIQLFFFYFLYMSFYSNINQVYSKKFRIKYRIDRKILGKKNKNKKKARKD